MPAHLPIFTLMGTSVLWGAAWLPLKFLHERGAAGLEIILVSYSVLLVISLAWAWRSLGYLRSHGYWLAAIALLGGGANVCFSYALVYGDVIRVMVLFYLLPVWGVLGGCFILRERTTAWRWCGVALAVLGAFIILGGPAIFDTPPSWVDWVALASGLLFAASNLVFRGVEHLPLAPKLQALFFGAVLISALVLALSQLPSGLAAAEFPWGAVLLYGATWLLLANVGSQWAVTKMPAGRSSIIIILELVTAVLTASLIAKEPLTGAVLLGGALILSATVVEIFAAEPAAKPANPA
jgi:drug/metabolite transporter (DMT)-like permease